MDGRDERNTGCLRNSGCLLLMTPQHRFRAGVAQVRRVITEDLRETLFACLLIGLCKIQKRVCVAYA